MGTYIGETAALLTAVMWAVTSLFFTAASRRIGSFPVNVIRIAMALAIIGTTVTITSGRAFPAQATTGQVLLLATSGVVGLTLGDTFLFRSLVILGPRLATLIFASWPIMAAILSWIFLGESLGAAAVIGIIVALAGIGWVTSERHSEWKNETVISDRGSKRFGVVMAFLGGLGQATGLVIAKHAMHDTLAPIEASYIRMIAACTSIWVYSGITGNLGNVLSYLRQRKAMLLTLGGAVSGPFLGIWMSLVAVKHADTGVAAAIMASVPVVIIPLYIAIYRIWPSRRAIAGALVTAIGITILFIR